jgi:cysteine synthase
VEHGVDCSTILALLGAGGSGTVTVLVTWLRTRVGDVTLTVTHTTDGPVMTVKATNVHGLGAEVLRRQINDVVSARSGAPDAVGEVAGR